MQIINDIQLDYNDVLIVPQTTTINHRGEVEVERHFKQLEPDLGMGYIREFKCCPVMNANMTQTGTFEIATQLRLHNMITCIHKFYTAKEINKYFENNDLEGVTFFITVGIRNKQEEIQKLKDCKDHMWSILIDVPNAYIPNVENYVKELRQEFPDRIIAVGNVCTGDRTQELIKAGANIVKVGIGPSCFAEDTLIKTSKGLIKIKNIEENDFVLTHTGTYKKVINKFKFENKDSLLDINGIKCTKNHKFFVINKNDIEKVNENNYQEYAYWMEAKDLTQNQLLIKLK